MNVINVMTSMINKGFINTGFQTFYISKEQSNCPLISEIIRVGKKFKERGILNNAIGTISLGYGKRILINGKDVDLANINREDILEIVDYDPIKKIALTIGQKEPDIETPIHWLIHHARNDVNAVIQLNSKQLIENIAIQIPETEKEQASGTLELAKEILKALRNSKRIIVKNKGVLFVGSNLKEAEELALKSCEETK